MDTTLEITMKRISRSTEMKRIKVCVTKEDIKQGFRNAPAYCPVAKALHRATGETWYVYGPEVAKAGREEHQQLSREATRFIVRFDTKKRVKPFKFLFKVPS